MDKIDRNMRQSRDMPCSFQTREDGGDLYIEGYFAVFNTRYEMWEDAAETILPGAFSDTLGGDIRALINHNTRLVLGRTKAGTIALHEDNIGLYGKIKVNREDVDAMNLYSRVQRGDVDQCSFGFDILEEEYVEEPETRSALWKIRKVQLYEVSVVTFPAYEQTAVSARKQDFEEIQKRRAHQWAHTMRSKLKGESDHGAESADASQEAD